jgi:hypothetical protein
MSDVLYAFYDLKVSPPTFDIAKFLVLAELERKKHNCERVHVVIPPGEESGFRIGDLDIFHKVDAKHFDVDSLRWRLKNIVAPLPWLLPTCDGVSICANRSEAKSIEKLARHVFPIGYTVDNPRPSHTWGNVLGAHERNYEIPSLSASDDGKKRIHAWVIENNLQEEKIVTITIRDSPYYPDRNGQRSQWVKFAREIKTKGFTPVFVNDTERAFKKNDGVEFIFMKEAPWNIELRLALYETAFVNMFTNGGPATMCRLDQNAPSITFVFPSEFMKKDFFRIHWRVEPGQQFPFLSRDHVLEWHLDDYDNIISAFNRFQIAVG